eukprot:scaffold685_cov191-Alexandrium_tamarense.AAC.14
MIARQGILSQFYLPFNPLSLLALCRHHRASRSVANTRVYLFIIDCINTRPLYPNSFTTITRFAKTAHKYRNTGTGIRHRCASLATSSRGRPRDSHVDTYTENRMGATRATILQSSYLELHSTSTVNNQDNT